MKSKKKLFMTLFLTLLAFAACVFVYAHAHVSEDTTPFAILPQQVTVLASQTTPTVSLPITTLFHPVQNKVSGPVPITIAIPILNISTSIIQEGVTATGAMDTPHVYGKVGWYAYGTVPGNIGSAVMAGHVNDDWGLPGVFRNLKNIQKGDEINVTLSTGTLLHFTVTDITSYNYLTAPAQQIFGQNDGAYLKLITCTGTSIPSLHTFDERLVVTATLNTQ